MTRSRAYARTKVFALAIVFAVSLAPDGGQGSPAPSPIGMVKDIKGGVIERQDREIWNPLVANSEIHANDRVRTGPGATAVLTLNDVGTVLIGPGTEYYLGDPARGFKSLLKRGYLWISTKLKPGSAMSIATTSAVAGVRGTRFSVLQDTAGTDICTCKGEVQVTLKDGKTVNVASGMYGEVKTDGTMALPYKGKKHLEMIWKEKPARYASCLVCHKKGKKPADLI